MTNIHNLMKAKFEYAKKEPSQIPMYGIAQITDFAKPGDFYVRPNDPVGRSLVVAGLLSVFGSWPLFKTKSSTTAA